MAVLTPTVLTIMRRTFARHVATVPHQKAVLNGAFQAIEDYLVGAASARPSNSISAAINAAGASALSVEEKRVVGAIVCGYRATLEGVL
jgi:hypothetical protein